MLRKWCCLLATAAVVAAGCGDDNNTDGVDAGVQGPDAGFVPPDAGAALCPEGAAAACQTAVDCAPDEPAQPLCAGCPAYNHSLCAVGVCRTPDMTELLTPGDPVNYVFQMNNSLQTTVLSFVGVVIDAEAAGGQVLTCDDIYERNLTPTQLMGGCYNLVDTDRRERDPARPDNQFTLTFSRFLGERAVLLVAYGYAEAIELQTNPLGISCMATQVGAPGSGMLRVPGDTMRSIQ